jgi:REP element-mobilizing transposase RayT
MMHDNSHANDALPVRRRRRLLRLPNFDYRQVGAYFVTICTRDRACVLGTVEEGEVTLSSIGHIVQTEWHSLDERFPGIEPDEFIVMPNHIHGILLFVGAQFIAPATRDVPVNEPHTWRAASHEGFIASTMHEIPVGAQFIAPWMRDAAGKSLTGSAGAMNCALTDKGDFSLGDVIRAFKAVSTRAIRTSGAPRFQWQRNYYEHVIRNERALDRIRQYIRANPALWHRDENNPAVAFPVGRIAAKPEGAMNRAPTDMVLPPRPAKGARQ